MEGGGIKSGKEEGQRKRVEYDKGEKLGGIKMGVR